MLTRLLSCFFVLLSVSVVAQSKNEIAIQGGINFKKGEIFSAEYNRSMGEKLRHAIGGSIDYMKLDKNTSLKGLSFEPMALLFSPFYEYKIFAGKFTWGVRGGISLGYSDYTKTEGITADKGFACGGVIQTNIGYSFTDHWSVKFHLKEYLLHSDHLDCSNTFALVGIGYKF